MEKEIENNLIQKKENNKKEKELNDLLTQYKIVSSNPSFYISRKEILNE